MVKVLPTKHDRQRAGSLFRVFLPILAIALIAWSIYASFIKPVINPNKNVLQKAAQINNPTYSPQPHFGGCANMRVYEYYRKKQ